MATSPFLRLPYAVPSSIGSAIDPSKVTPVLSTNYELDAAGHWLLGGSSASLTDIKSGALLTFAGGATAPVYSSNFVTLSGNAGGLKSPTADRLDRTVCVVFKYSASGSFLIGGSWSGSTGAVIYQGAASILVAPSPVALTNPAAAGNWVFAAFSTATNLTRRAKIGGGTVLNGSAAHTLHGNVAIGDQSSGGLVGAADYAEFIVFNRAMTEAEMDAIYARSKVRMAARGLAVY